MDKIQNNNYAGKVFWVVFGAVTVGYIVGHIIWGWPLDVR